MDAVVQDLSKKVVLITGAGRGLGKALALGFASRGAAIACLARSSNEIEAVAQEIEAGGGRAVAVTCDVTSLESLETAYKRVADELGGIDIVFVNAGVNNVRELIGEDDPELWRNTIDINLTGAYYTMRAAIPYLKARGGGKIITIGSGRGHRGDTTGSSYACSKAGLWMLVRVLAQELRPYKIAVNELVPGPVMTAMNAKFSKDKIDPIFTEGKEWVKEPEDILPIAYFIVSLPNDGPTAQTYSLMAREM